MAHFVQHFLLISLCSLIHGLPTDPPPVVQTSNGLVSGYQALSFKGRNYYGFIGIPYAQPAVGNLRFKPPVPVSNWSGTLDGTKSCDVCPQLSGNNVVGSENCLCLNVFTPQLPRDGFQPYPVMVFIHGGSFTGGSIGTYGPQRFMDQNVTIVVAAYRLGALGFLCTGDSASPGNYGSLDNVEALRWVQKNIGYFGGDRNKVVAFGQSSGAAAVDYLRLAQNTEGLYHGMISESGAATQPWAFVKNPLYIAKQVAVNLNCPTTNTAVMVDCIRAASTSAIVQASGQISNPINYFPFAPCAEDPHKGVFLRGEPRTLMRSGKFNRVPVIMGTNKDEGVTFYQNVLQGSTAIDENYFATGFPKIVKQLTTDEDTFQWIAKAAREKYFGNISLSNQTAASQALMDFIADSTYSGPTQFSAQVSASYGVPFYAYSFQYLYPGLATVKHTQELMYLWYLSVPVPPSDQQMSDLMVSMWVNFANNLTPSSIWQPTTPSKDLRYVRLANDEVAMHTGYRTTFAEFWNKDVPKISGFEDLVSRLWGFLGNLHLQTEKRILLV